MLENEGYSAEYRDDRRSYRGSYARRNPRRDAIGRYSRDGDEIVEQLEDMMDEAHDERTRLELKKLIDKMKHH